MTRTQSRDLHLLAILLILAALLGCGFEPEPEYCYRSAPTTLGEVWYCEGSAQYPHDTLPDTEKEIK